MIGIVKYVCTVLNADDHGEGNFLSFLLLIA
jgi:K+ transporter